MTAEAVNRPAIKRDCYWHQVMKNEDADTKVPPKRGHFLSQHLASPFPSEEEIGREQDNAVLSDMPDHQMCKRGTRKLLLCL